ncbi:hypothetical protein Tco_1103863 [Tanacetum coccineum]
MPLLAAMLSQAGEGAGVYLNLFLSLCMRLTNLKTSDPIAQVFEHGQSSDPDIASFSQVQETNDAPFTSTNMDDEPLGCSFHAFSPGPLKLPCRMYNSFGTKLKAHKQLFKDVVGKLVKQVKAMEVKLKIKKRKVVVSDSNKEDGGEQDVDSDALHVLANAAVTVDSTKSPGGASSNPAACSYDPTTDVPTDVPSGKCKEI